MDKLIKKIKKGDFVLFLGAGINCYTKNDREEQCPMSDELSYLISRDLLEDETLAHNGLDEVAEIARYKLGDEIFYKYMFHIFENFEPNNIHNILVKLPWKKIYTTNYDKLIEKASENEKIKIKTILNQDCNLEKKEKGIVYCKLHGCVSSLKEEDSLVITKEDYQVSNLYREKFFEMLKNDLLENEFLFLGYSMKDINFRKILSECRKIKQNKLPHSYSIQKMPNKIQRDFWKDKYNIEILDVDILNFLQKIK